MTAIAHDSSTNSGYQTTQSTASWSHTVSSTDGCTYLVVAVAMLGATGVTVTSIDQDGLNLSQRTSAVTADGTTIVEVWGLEGPAAGAQTLNVDLSAPCDFIAMATSFTGVKRVTPVASTANDNGAGTANASLGQTITTSGQWVYVATSVQDINITSSAGTQRANVNGAFGTGASATSGPLTAGTTTVTWSAVGAGLQWAIAGIVLNPVPAEILATDQDFIIVEEARGNGGILSGVSAKQTDEYEIKIPGANRERSYTF